MRMKKRCHKLRDRKKEIEERKKRDKNIFVRVALKLPDKIYLH